MDENVLYITNFVSIALFVISEILGMSTCEYNGVFHFAIGGCFCKRKIYVDVSSEEHVI